MTLFGKRFSYYLIAVGCLLALAPLAGFPSGPSSMVFLLMGAAFRADEQLSDIRLANQILTGGFIKLTESITIVGPEDMKSE